MISIAEFASLDERNEPLLGRCCPSDHNLQKDGKSDNERCPGVGKEVAIGAGPDWEADGKGLGLERSVAGNAYDMADIHFHENHGRVYGWSSFADPASVTAHIDNKWSHEPRELSRELRRIGRNASDTRNGYKRALKPAITPDSPSNIPSEWRNWKTPNHPQHPHWRPNEEFDYPPYQPLSIPDPQLIIHNTPPSPSASLHTRPSDNPHQASTPPHFNRSNPTQPRLPQQPICGKSLEVMEVEAAFILMVIRHQTPEAAAVAMARELRLAQEEQLRRAGSPCGSEDTVVGSEYDDGEGWFVR